ncbi:GTPase-activator protein, putative [Trichomonas vaginalis G3]|uniref:GTPase-activator protein, putative n=1 Tax=Trichomonas vaginalis (strain ATCC PRA-98 / G3) TaxID=412133 RepID=A2DLG7_TRIV3|nr:negative regulation of centriole-centriole cohesion [Trichomonas vaginalis G3]EAY18785.1 GTPase-activator protein, putative [Trichomonas vaginalis G3]KAI5539279.1 negative regulation of centriole-centriole cohesion [Trichomonas vaginalis G3]|eukprot:XP_001579771.1 GTPase-activator protein [Trichomonas vaginalis G3]
MDPKYDNIKQLIDALVIQITESLVTDPIITQEEESFVANFVVTNQNLVNLYPLINGKEQFHSISTILLEKISSIIDSTATVTLNNSRFATVYLQALVKCIEKVSQNEHGDFFKIEFLEKVISLVEKVMNHDNPDLLRSSYTKFTQTIGSISTQVFTIFEAKIKDLLSKLPKMKDLRFQLLPFTRFIASYHALKYGLRILLEVYQDFKLYLNEYCNTISTIIMTSFRNNPSEFMNRIINNNDALQIFELLKKDKSISDSSKYEALISLSFLLHAQINNGSLESITSKISNELSKKVSGFDQSHYSALQAALYSALAVAETNGFQSYIGIFKIFAPSLVEKLHSQQQVLFEYYYHLRYFICVDLPVALYFTSYGYFVDVMKYFVNENTLMPRQLTCRTIDKCMSVKMNSEQKNLLQSALINMLESLSSGNDVLVAFPLLFHAFEVNPDILDEILKINHGLTMFLWRPCPTNGIRSLCNAFISAFKKDEYKLNDWIVIDCTISSILNNLDFFMALKPEIISDLGRIFLFILDLVKYFLEKEECRKFVQIPQMMVTVMQMEVVSLVFLPTPISSICLTILQEVINIDLKYELDTQLQLPINIYQEFIDICKSKGKFDVDDNATFAPLLKLKKENKSITYAYIKHLGNLAYALDPTVVDESLKKTPNAMSPSTLRDEFTKTALLLETMLIKTSPNNYLTVINECMKSPSYIGNDGSVIFARIVRPQIITPILQSVLIKMQEIGYEFTDVHTQYTANSMKMVQNLIQKYEWEVGTVESFLIEHISMVFVSYMNLLVSAQRLYQCSQFLITALTKSRNSISKANKMELSVILASWLARIDCGPSTEKAGQTICNALAKVVEDLSFSLDNYDDLVFLTTNLNTRLLKQQSLVKSISNAIACLFKSNFWLFSRSELAKTLIGTDLSRAGYVNAAHEALVNSRILPPKKEDNLIDYLFIDNFRLLKEIVSFVPVKQSEQFSIYLVKAAVSRHVEFDFINFMTDLELEKTSEVNKNTILRGNAVPSRSIISFSKIFGREWLKTIYSPMSNLAKEIVKSGKSINIKTKYVPSNENIEENRKTFRQLFIKSIDIITNSIPRLPTQIIRMVQIVYKKVAEKFQDNHGIMIVNGIIFLRLIIPNLTAPPNEEEEDKFDISEEERQVLVSVCIALMAASLRGDLTDKGEDYLYFNDVASLALDRFTATVDDIIKTDIKGAAFKYLETDENIVCQNLSETLCSLRKDLDLFYTSRKNDKEAEKLYNFVLKYDKIKTRNFISCKKQSDFDQLPREMKEFMMIKPTDEELYQLEQFIFIDTPFNSDFEVVYYVSSLQNSSISEKTIMSYLFNLLLSINNDIIFVLDMSHVDVEKLPKGQVQIKKFMPVFDMCFKSIKHFIVLRSSYEFGEYFVQNRQFTHYSDTFVFATSEKDIYPLNSLSDKIPMECKEALNNEGFPQTTIINKRETTIRVSRFSLHTLIKIGAISVNNCYMLNHIHSISDITAPDENLEFTVYVNNEILVFTTFPASGLYYLIKSAFARANSKSLKYPQICTDSNDKSSTCWLLLLISLTGLMEADCHFLWENSFNLLKSVNNEYQLSIDIPETVEECRQKATDILRIACNKRPEDVGHVIIEFEKIFSVLKNPLPVVKLLPGITEFLLSSQCGYLGRRFLIELHCEDEESMLFIKNKVWKEIMSKQEYGPAVFEVLLPMFDENNKELLYLIAMENKSFVSSHIVKRLMDRLQSAPSAALLLLEGNLFDIKNHGADLLHACLIALGRTAQDDVIVQVINRLLKDISKRVENAGMSGVISVDVNNRRKNTTEVIKVLKQTSFFGKIVESFERFADENDISKEYLSYFKE